MISACNFESDAQNASMCRKQELKAVEPWVFRIIIFDVITLTIYIYMFPLPQCYAHNKKLQTHVKMTWMLSDFWLQIGAVLWVVRIHIDGVKM